MQVLEQTERRAHRTRQFCVAVAVTERERDGQAMLDQFAGGAMTARLWQQAKITKFADLAARALQRSEACAADDRRGFDDHEVGGPRDRIGRTDRTRTTAQQLGRRRGLCCPIGLVEHGSDPRIVRGTDRSQHKARRSACVLRFVGHVRYANPMRILVVEDDALVADAIRRGLTEAGFAVDHVTTAEQAEASLLTGEFDLAVIDIGLPGADGLSLVRTLRRQRIALPVLILTARDGLADRVNALDIGADDYLVKPFAVPELQARARALLRRNRAGKTTQLTIGDLSIDLAARLLKLGSESVELTRREWSVLECLVLDIGQVVSKDRLLQAIAGWDEDLTPNAFEVYVSRLRAKLGTHVALRTIRGLGYRLDGPAA